MKPEKTYQYLKDLAEQIGITIRYEDFSDQEIPAKSGLCKLKGQHFYYMDSSKNLSQKIMLLSQCLSQMNLENIYVLPAIRKLLEDTRIK